jgi:hypothetical protein
MKCPTCGVDVPRRLRGGKCDHCGTQLIVLPTPPAASVCDVCAVRSATAVCDVCGAIVCSPHSHPFIEKTAICLRCLNKVPVSLSRPGPSCGFPRDAIISLLHCVAEVDVPILERRSTFKQMLRHLDLPSRYWQVAGVRFGTWSDAVAARPMVLTHVRAARQAWGFE